MSLLHGPDTNAIPSELDVCAIYSAVLCIPPHIMTAICLLISVIPFQSEQAV